MTAQLILIISLTLQATVQPYESRMLNMLDIMSVLVLVITQILSILFLYLDTLEGPLPYESFGLDRTTLETGMTVMLFFTNVGVVVLLYFAYVARMVYEKCGETKRKLLESRRDAAEASGNVSGKLKSIGSSLELKRLSRTKSLFAFAQTQSFTELMRQETDVALHSLWYDAHGIEIGDVVSHPALGTKGVVCGIDVDDDGSVHVDFGTEDSEAKVEILDLDDWLEISSAVGFSISRPVGFISAVASRLERDSRAAQLRGDFVELHRLELQFKMLTLPSAIKKMRAEMETLKKGGRAGGRGAAVKGGVERRAARKAKRDLERALKETVGASRKIDVADRAGVSHGSDAAVVGIRSSAHDSTPLPPGWKSQDSGVGEHYFYHEDTHETTWEHPGLLEKLP